VNSSGIATPNWVAQGGSPTCGVPREIFGQAYGAPEGNPPFLTGSGKVTTCGLTDTIVSDPLNCLGYPQLPITTKYERFGGARASVVRVTRTFGFDATNPAYSGVGLRPYVPRLPLGTFTYNLRPNRDTSDVTYAQVSGCGDDCLVAPGPTWNGRWFANVDTANDYAFVVVRDPASTSDVLMTVNNDGASNSNLSSFVLVQPSGGWKAPVTEVEWFCFEDHVSWPLTERTAGMLPADCRF
jgi:hypothetical protein